MFGVVGVVAGSNVGVGGGIAFSVLCAARGCGTGSGEDGGFAVVHVVDAFDIAVVFVVVGTGADAGGVVGSGGDCWCCCGGGGNLWCVVLVLV